MERDDTADGIEPTRRRRARTLAGILRDLPRETLPEDRAEAIRRAARATRRPVPVPLIRAAAALLLLAGLGAVVVLATRERYRPLRLTVIDVPASGAHDEDLAFEYIYGPDGDAARPGPATTDRR